MSRIIGELTLKELWVDSHAPSSFEEYTFQNEHHKNQIQQWIKDKSIPGLLLHGPAGTGKTACAKLLIKELDIHDYDVMIVNGSNEGRQIDWLRDKLEAFCQSMPFGDFKIVLIDEAEFLNCLEENEKVLMSNGTLKHLKDMQPGVDYDIISYNVETGQYEPDVACIVNCNQEEVYNIRFDDGSSISVTVDHPFMVIGDNGAVEERSLFDLQYDVEGIKFINKNGGFLTSSSEPQYVGIRRVIDINVRNNHTFVHESGCVVHNCNSVQPALRHMIELYSSSVRFILTANYPTRIIPALHSRLQSIAVEKSDINEYTAKMAEILLSEGIDFDLDTLDSYVNAYYPDFRKCINTLQLNSQTGKLINPKDVSNTQDYLVAMVDLFKNGKINQARKLLCKNALAEDMEAIYRWCYEHLEYFGDTPEKQDDAVLIIKRALVDHTICADPEINLADCMIRLARNLE